MIASQLGAVQAANSIEQAASHCEQYVEVTNRGNGTNNKNVVPIMIGVCQQRLKSRLSINIRITLMQWM